LVFNVEHDEHDTTMLSLISSRLALARVSLRPSPVPALTRALLSRRTLITTPHLADAKSPSNPKPEPKTPAAKPKSSAGKSAQGAAAKGTAAKGTAAKSKVAKGKAPPKRRAKVKAKVLPKSSIRAYTLCLLQ
jgi:hypothetical protein